MNGYLRAAIAALAIGALSWVGVGIYRAGGDVPPPPLMPQTKLTSGHAEGRRIDGKPSWSLDYDHVVASPDTTIATLENVHHGILYRRGKPFMTMVAKHVIVNTISDDFVVTGPLELIENDGKHRRRLTSNAATYSSDGARVTVASASVDFRSGDMHFGRLLGLY
jgi:hypothetical protein